MRKRSWAWLTILVAIEATAGAPHSHAAPPFDTITPTANYPYVCHDATQADPEFACQTDNANVYFYAQGSLTSSEKSLVYTMIGDEY